MWYTELPTSPDVPDAAATSCVMLGRGPISHRNTHPLIPAFSKSRWALPVHPHQLLGTYRQTEKLVTGRKPLAGPVPCTRSPYCSLKRPKFHVPVQQVDSKQSHLCVQVKYVCIFHVWEDVCPGLTLSPEPDRVET